jgi:hypothetical protein
MVRFYQIGEIMSAIRELFVTRIYEASLAADRDWPGFRDELEEACLMLARIEQLGRVRVDDYAWMKDDNWQAVLRDPVRR